MKKFSVIVGLDKNRGIGEAGRLPWPSLSGDMIHFKKITSHHADPSKKNAVIMGRRTWASIPERFRPLLDRINIVITSRSRESILEGIPENNLKHDEVVIAKNFQEALEIANNSSFNTKIENIFIVGGGQIYEEAVKHPDCQRLYVTHIDADMKCDTFFPSFEGKFKQISKESPLTDGNLEYYFAEYTQRAAGAGKNR